jgi:hypothetical protein
LVKAWFSKEDIDAAVQQLAREGTVVVSGEMVVDSATWHAVFSGVHSSLTMSTARTRSVSACR